MDDHLHNGEKPTADQDATIAWEAMRRGDLTHAAFHIGCALATDPARPEWLHMLDQIIERAEPDPLRVAPLDPKQTYFATAAVRAYIAERVGKLDEAVALLLGVIHAKPDAPYGVWLMAWKDRPGFPAALDPRTVISAVVDTVWNTPEFRDDPKADRTAITRVAPLLAMATDLHPEEPRLWILRALCLRKMGQYEEALRVAQQGYTRHAGYEMAVSIARIHQVQGHTDAAIATYENALTFKPDDVAVRNDIADILIERGEFEQGLRWYRAVLDREPEQEWALPSALYYMHLLHPDGGWLHQLRTYGERNTQNERAQALLRRAEHRANAYVAFIPRAGEASINIARHLLEKAAQGEIKSGSTVSMGLSHLESPSSRLAIEMALALYAPDIKLDLSASVATIPTPDTRAPLRPVEYLLWTYQGSDAAPNVAPPPTSLSSAIAQLAREPFNLSVWRTQARRLAAEIGVQNLEGLLGVMVHPPLPPAGHAAWDWIREVQLASALVIAQLDGSWEGSLRRIALLSLAYGPMDWTGEMAIVALADLAAQEPATQPEILSTLFDLMGRRPSEGAWALDAPLLYTLARWPGLGEEKRAQYLQLMEHLGL